MNLFGSVKGPTTKTIFSLSMYERPSKSGVPATFTTIDAETVATRTMTCSYD